MNINETAYKYAIKNAFEHGTAQMGAVVGKVKALFPETEMKELVKISQEEVKKVNALDKKIIETEHQKFDKEGWELKVTEKEKTLPELDWVKTSKTKKIITRVAPNPSGAMHFGHARPSVISDEYVKKYGGELILRFDDTDPKVKTSVAGIEKEFIKDFDWLGIKFSKIERSSDRLPKYYEIAEQIIKKGKAYVCFCKSEDWKKLIWESKECECRKKNIEEQLKQWKRMLAHEIKEEQAVLRFKSDLTNKDPSTRDWWLAKVVDTVNHPNPLVRDKHVWPSYNLASAVDDKEMNINFIARGQEHVQNGEKQKMLYDLFGWEYPHCVYFGKIDKLGNMILSKSKMKLLMEKEGIVGQYDDPRMTTIMAFRRRGFRPETIRKIILDMGVNTKTAKITIENLGSTNKEFLGEVKELPFFEEGIETEIIGMIEGDGESYGEKVKFSGGIEKLIVDKKEALKYKNKLGTIVRLKKAFNAKVIEATEFSMKLQFISYAKTEHPVISWVKGIVDAEIIMDDASKRVGITAKSALEEKGIKHFEGLGYANIEEIKGNYVRAVFAHK